MDASVSFDQEILSGPDDHVEVEVSVFQIEREEPEDAIIRIRLGNRLRQRRRRQRLRTARSEAERMEPLQNECALQVTAHETEQPEIGSENLEFIQEGQLENLNNAESSIVEDTADQLEENRETIDLQDFERILRRRESIRLSQQRRRERLRNLSRSLESSDPLARCRDKMVHNEMQRKLIEADTQELQSSQIGGCTATQPPAWILTNHIILSIV